MPALALIVLIAALVGVLIGAVGIGGVALPPALIWLVGLDPHTAAGTSSWSFLFTGLLGTALYARNSVMPWRLVGWLTLGIVPAAMLGSLANGALPERVAMLPLAALVTVAGVHSLWTGRAASRRSHDLIGAARLSPRSAITIGVFVGFCSALTGTGGPVILMPILLAVGIPALTAVAASQVVQIPLVAFASIGYASQGAVEFGLGTMIGVIAAVGVVGGGAVALKLRQEQLRRLAGVALTVFGAALLGATVFSFFGS